jgi:hypothetical protein
MLVPNTQEKPGHQISDVPSHCRGILLALFTAFWLNIAGIRQKRQRKSRRGGRHRSKKKCQLFLRELILLSGSGGLSRTFGLLVGGAFVSLIVGFFGFGFVRGTGFGRLIVRGVPSRPF